ncbi:hypothetical protein KEJ27_03720 [Candidatus Bathyarchaeota archaeon]|nr:hypothetical protein [Candidatus Bathyarchaeota archaeon]MBS7612921.1 hypothetical protein [Candidatus Bathyarchaeota archaeon]MBS7618018.1 hypothetical protein [Candidatus Bathyarchaeota archaeon]
MTSISKRRFPTWKTILCIIVILIVLGYMSAIPYLVEIVDVYYSIEQHIPEYLKLTVAIELRNNTPLEVIVGGALILHCTLMNGSRRDITYPLSSRTVKPQGLETLETTIFFTFTTPEKTEAIYTYSVDAVIFVRGILSSRTIEVKSIYSVGEA